MNEQPKSKVLIIIIGILLIANIVMLGFFLAGAGDHNQKREHSGKNSYVGEYLEKEVGFNADQLARYDSLSKLHREEMKATFGELSTKRKRTFEALAAASFSDSAINNAANEMHDRQAVLELSQLRHVKEIRDICTEGQLRRFDTGFYKIFRKRSETHKEK
ncbi:MAG: periplasmic heavy metal sensor [Ferruginibacter sp.]